MDNKYETDNANLVSDIAFEPEVIDSYKHCIYCNEKLEKNLLYCTACGKEQKEENYIPVKKMKKIRKKKKTGNKNLVKIFSAISYVFFSLSFISLALGFMRMLFFNNVSISIFGSNSDALIANQTLVIGSLLISIIFLIAGIFLNCKSEKININKKQ